jgi:uncharacterized protein YbjQ (UPF0145 family)
MIPVTTTCRIEKHRIIIAMGMAHGTTFEEMLHHAEELSANVIISAAYDPVRTAGFSFHNAAAVAQPLTTIK